MITDPEKEVIQETALSDRKIAVQDPLIKINI